MANNNSELNTENKADTAKITESPTEQKNTSPINTDLYDRLSRDARNRLDILQKNEGKHNRGYWLFYNGLTGIIGLITVIVLLIALGLKQYKMVGIAIVFLFFVLSLLWSEVKTKRKDKKETEKQARIDRENAEINRALNEGSGLSTDQIITKIRNDSANYSERNSGAGRNPVKRFSDELNRKYSK